MLSTIFFTFKPFAASSIFEFPDPDTSHKHTAKSLPELFKKINTYREQNRLEPIQNLPLVVNHYLCGLPQNQGKCEPQPTMRRGLWPTIKGGILLLESLLYKKFVSAQTADIRAKQCVSCKFNKFHDKGPFILYTNALAQAMVGKRRSIYHNQLGECSVCLCPLRSKVFYDGDVDLTPEQVTQMETVDCWQLKLKNTHK